MFIWLEDEEINVGNPAARVRRPQRHSRPQLWLDRNELTDLLAAVRGRGPITIAARHALETRRAELSERPDATRCAPHETPR